MLGSASDFRDFEVSLPAELERYGGTVSVRIAGNATGPTIVVLGGISGNRFVCRDQSGAPGWWPGLVGEGYALDPRNYCIVGMDFAADPTGRSAPSTEQQALVLATALDAAGVDRLHSIVGASYGGMVGLAFASRFGSRLEKLVVISASAQPGSAACASRALQRRVVEMGLKSGTGDEALAIARGMAMLTYRTPAEFDMRFRAGLRSDDPLGLCEAGSYLRERGRVFRGVMSPERFLSLSASIDRHRIDPAAVKVPTLLIGANSDQLVPPGQLATLAEDMHGRAELHLLDCLFGHDMFLKEPAKIGAIIKPFLEAEA